MKRPSAVLLKATTSGGLLGAMAIAGGTTAYGDILATRVSNTTTNPRLLTPTPTGIPADLTNTAGAATTTVNWDVNSDGIIDFTFTNRYPNTATGSGVVWQMNMNPATGTAATNGILGYTGPFVRYAFALQANAPIGPGGAFSTVTQVVLGSQYRYNGTPYFYGGFAAGPNGNGAVPPGTNAYAGFRFQAADGVHYGWIRLNINANGTTSIIDFSNAGYETAPNTQILAGVPEPGTMAMMAMGAAALLGAAIKRRRS